MPKLSRLTPARAVVREAAVLGRAGIGFQGDLAIGREAQPAAGRLQEGVDGLRREQAGRAATEEHAVHHAAPDQRQVLVEVGDQCIDIGVERQGSRAACANSCELKSQYGHLRTHHGRCTYSDSGGGVSMAVSIVSESRQVAAGRAGAHARSRVLAAYRRCEPARRCFSIASACHDG